MIPIRDTIPSRNFPVVNTAIILVNALVYLVEMSQGPGLERFIYTFGLVPARYTSDQVAAYFTTGQQVLAPFTYMFLHGGFWHLLGNMWSLYIFGDNVEDRLGPLRYLGFYVTCGLLSALTHFLFNSHSAIPTIGASGAIAGVMGAYFILHPNAKILTLVPIIFIPWFFEIPAFVFLGLWFVMQFLSATGSQLGSAGGIAWWAHIGGFICGIVVLKAFSRVPAAGISTRLQQATRKRTTHKLQVIRPIGPGSDPNLYGTIRISPYEALIGTRKLVNIPWGFQKRIIRVTVPPGMREGGKLRLKGLGKITRTGERGDLFLRVEVSE